MTTTTTMTSSVEMVTLFQIQRWTWTVKMVLYLCEFMYECMKSSAAVKKFFRLVFGFSLALLNIAKTAIVCFKLCNYMWCYSHSHPHPWLYNFLVFSSNFMSRSMLLCISLPRWSACMMCYMPLVLSDNKRPQANLYVCMDVCACMCVW